MPYISAIIEILDESNARIDLPVQGVQQPIALKLDTSTLDVTSRDRGDGITEVLIGARGGSGAGATGASGASGNPGATGASGASGNPGATGASGASGNPGASGTPGPIGHYVAADVLNMDLISGAVPGDDCYVADTMNTWHALPSGTLPVGANVRNGIGVQWVFSIATLAGKAGFVGGICRVSIPNFPSDALVVSIVRTLSLGAPGDVDSIASDPNGFTIISKSSQDGSLFNWLAIA